MNSIKKTLSKSLKFNTNINSILYNRYVLYVFVFMAVIDLMYFASSGDVRSLFTLIIIGFLTSFFNKNMIVILFISLVFTHILKYGTNVSEGMKDGTDVVDGTDDTGITDVTDNSGNVIDTMTTKLEPENINEKGKKIDSLTKEKPVTKDSLMKDFQNYEDLQSKILKGMKDIEQSLRNAESFIERFEHYKNIQEYEDKTSPISSKAESNFSSQQRKGLSA
jgi:hypothetical protein